jgi:hypothetical protein
METKNSTNADDFWVGLADTDDLDFLKATNSAFGLVGGIQIVVSLVVIALHLRRRREESLSNRRKYLSAWQAMVAGIRAISLGSGALFLNTITLLASGIMSNMLAFNPWATGECLALQRCANFTYVLNLWSTYLLFEARHRATGKLRLASALGASPAVGLLHSVIVFFHDLPSIYLFHEHSFATDFVGGEFDE